LAQAFFDQGEQLNALSADFVAAQILVET